MPGRQQGTPAPGRQAGTLAPGRPPATESTSRVEQTATPVVVPSLQATILPSLSAGFPDWFFRQEGSIFLKLPASLVIDPDGTLWLTNLGDNRVYHLDVNGKSLGWFGGTGVFVDQVRPEAGLFNEPWGLTLSPDGALFVADTWNHRIQKFSKDGTLILDWGLPGQGKQPYGLFGPRAVAVSSKGVVFVADTGNHRIVAYTAVGKYIGETAGPGSQAGQLDEPTGLWLDDSGKLYVADSWNRRVQVFTYQEGSFKSEKSWRVNGWETKSLDFKPYLCGIGDRLYLTDPEKNHVLVYTTQGEYLKMFDLNVLSLGQNGRATGIACDRSGGIWVSLMTANTLVNLRP